jgi:FKBP-type peptidyl-prolyl cis-trans isomerase
MVVGEKARIRVPAALAYGERRTEKSVPAGSLVCDIELLDFK